MTTRTFPVASTQHNACEIAMATKHIVQQTPQELDNAAKTWIRVLWGLTSEPTPEQIAAALLMEARDHDESVRTGENSPDYPAALRDRAFQILDELHKRAEYGLLKETLTNVLRAVPQEADYTYRIGFGGHLNNHDRAFIDFKTDRALRKREESKDALTLAKKAIDRDGRFGTLLHYMRGLGDYCLIVQFGDPPVLE